MSKFGTVIMKRLVSAISALLLAAAAASAQTPSLGAGYICSAQFNIDSPGYAFANGFYAGAGYKHPLTKSISLGTGLYVSCIGSSAATFLNLHRNPLASAPSLDDVAMTESYITLPVSAVYSYKFSPSLGIFAHGGMALDCCIDSRAYAKWEDGLGSTGSNGMSYFSAGSHADSYGRWDILAGAGFGLDIKKSIRLEAGCYYGLLDRSGADSINLHRAWFNVGVSYLFSSFAKNFHWNSTR